VHKRGFLGGEGRGSGVEAETERVERLEEDVAPAAVVVGTVE
jgi:hypothetical protein